MKHLSIIVAIILLTTAPLLSQWRILVPNFIPSSSNENCYGGNKYQGGGIYFEGNKIFVAPPVYLPDGIGPKVLLSSDTGKTWKTFTPFDNNSIQSISFTDNNTGIIATDGGVLYLTNDGGNSWVQRGGLSNSRIVALSTNIFICSGVSPTLTTDAGTTWRTYLPYSLEGALFPICKDNLGSLYYTGDNTIYITRDSGATWIKRTVSVDPDSYSITAHTSCHDSVIYVANEDAYGTRGAINSNGHSDIFVSRDGGKTFRSVYTDSYSLTGGGPTGTIRAGKNGVAYSATFNGIIRTTDYGDSWHSIGGPGGRFDVHSFALLDDSTLVALDTVGNVWITENSGGLPMPKPKVQKPVVEGFTLTNISSCHEGFGSLFIRHVFCSPLFITNISYDSALTNNFTFILPSLPDTLTEIGRLIIPVHFDPKTEVGAFNGNIKVKAFYIDDGDTIHVDTTINFSAWSVAQPPKLTRDINFADMGSISLCGSPTDTIVTLTNRGCDTLSITQGPGTLTPEFQLLTTLSLPIDLPPDSSLTVRFRFFPSGVGSFGCSPRFRAEQQGLWQDIEFELTGKGTEGDGVFSYEPQSFDFNALSICSHDSGSGYVTNTGCDTLSLTDAKLFADADYTMSPLPPLALIPDDTIRYQVYLNPQMKGVRRGYIVFSSTNRSGLRRDSIPLTVNVTDGTRILASSGNTLNFGITTLCEERDSVVTLHNTGCDTLRITNVDLIGNGFSTNSSVPIIIPPGSSITIPITTKVDTSQGSISTGSITFTSDADNKIAPITLSRGYTYPKSYSFHIAMVDATATSGEIVRLAIVGEQGLGSAGSGVNRLDFDLSLNEDLLEYIRPEGSNTVSKNGSRIAISNPNELITNKDTLAILVYHVFLTKDSATDITVSNTSINNGDTSSCAPKISAITQAGFTYMYECGDKHIQSFLRTGQASLEITSIRPNPAREEVLIGISSINDTKATISVIDISGGTVSTSQHILRSGQQQIFLPTSQIAIGSYIIEIATNENSKSGKLIIVK